MINKCIFKVKVSILAKGCKNQAYVWHLRPFIDVIDARTQLKLLMKLMFSRQM